MSDGLTAIILAAGCGSRLGSSSGITKCLTMVGGRSLLRRQVEAMTPRVGRIAVVAGHEQSAVRRELDAIRGPAVDIVVNERYRETGTAESLRRGLTAVSGDSDVLIVEGDVVFEPEVLDRVLASGESSTALQRWGPACSGTAAVVSGEWVTDWVHERERRPGFSPERHHKTVNITRLARATWQSLLQPALADVLRARGEQSPLELAMRQLVLADGRVIRAVPVTDGEWCEIDTPEDLAIAQRIFGRSVARSGAAAIR
jgi:choline kinase